MVQTAQATRPGGITPQFLQPACRLVRDRAARVEKLLGSRILKNYLNNPAASIRNWPQNIAQVMNFDWDFESAMDRIDALPKGVVLDKSDALMRQLYRDLGKGVLSPSFGLNDFTAIPTSGDFDLGEYLVRSFGIVFTIIESGKRMGLFQRHLDNINDRFERGYTMLRAIEILSERD